MNTRILVGFLWNTFWLGGLAGLVASFFINPEIYLTFLNPFDAMEILGLLIFYLGLGLTFAAISLTGFFAYLFINRMGLNLFRAYWPAVQVVLILFILFDIIYFPYRATDNIAIYWFILLAAAMLLIGWIVAKIKVKETNRKAFIPTLFFMVVFTTVEWVPGLMVDGTDYAWLMVVPLLVSNTYQILNLHRMNSRFEEKTQTNKENAKNNKTSKKKKK